MNKITSAKKRGSYLEIVAPYRVNLTLILLVVIMICYGLIMLFSASMSTGYHNEADPLHYMLNQGLFTLIGLCIATIIIAIPIRVFDRMLWVVVLYAAMVALLIYTSTFGVVLGNAKRWIAIGDRTFQPSELVKVGLIFCIAGYRSFVLRQRKNGRFNYGDKSRQALADALIDIVMPACAILVCLILVVLQPHMSWFIIMAIICLICFVVSSIPIKTWLYGGVIMMLILSVGFGFFMAFASESHQARINQEFEHVGRRINIFKTMHADKDTLGAASEHVNEDDVYQNEQSMIAIGSGGVAGVGFGNSRQKYRYLPEAHNDYVFSIVGEELGFLGGLSIILLFWIFLVIGFSIAWKTTSVFSRIICVGYTSLISLQAFLNIGVALGVVPPTGITLPFFSYGGTANLFFTVAIGMILAVSRTGIDRRKITYIT